MNPRDWVMVHSHSMWTCSFPTSKMYTMPPWNRFEVANTVKLIWEEYRKKKSEIKGYIEIPEPRLCP